MADLSFLDKNQLEKLFGMESGYVLDFSNRTFREFIIDAVRKDIEDEKYQYASGSKANRLRQFWKVESNYTVGLLTNAMAEYALTLPNPEKGLAAAALTIAKRLMGSGNVEDLDAIVPITDDRAFEGLAKAARESIDNNEPEAGIDRLHTFLVKYVRARCQQRGIATDRKKPLHSIFGEYRKALKAEGLIESDMTDRILKSCISTLEAFNDVRNNKSYAHDNSVLTFDEALYIYSHVCSLVRLLQSIEQASDSADDDSDEVAVVEPEDSCPF